jgi:hypothetical protein
MKTRSLSVLLAGALLFASCGDTSDDAADPGGDTGTTFPAGDRGWLEGDDLDWTGGGDAFGAEGDLDMAAETAYSDDGAPRSTTTVAAGDVSDIGPIEPPIEPPIDDTPLRAGSIDDGEDVEAYLDYREVVLDSGVEVRPLDVRDSTVITVTGDNGLPVLDAIVEIVADGGAVTLRTTADGSVRFSPAAMNLAGDTFSATVTVGEASQSVEFAPATPSVGVTVEAPGGVDGSVPLDVLFVLDATGSMGDEIARLRENMTSVATQIAALPSAPDVRFGMTVYRDEGDLFVTRTFDLTGDLDAFLAALADVQADGGGDYPEALDEALADALEKPEWRRDGAVELMFVVADAPPQVGRNVQQPYTATAIAAAERGVKIFPVSASGTDDQAEYVMRELAFVTGGRFVFLSYGAGGSTATGDVTDITADDYDELPLDALVVRLVQDELSALTGVEAQPVPTTSAPITTTTYEQ